MKVIVKGDPKEIAALALEMQGQQSVKFSSDLRDLAQILYQSICDRVREAQANR